MIDLTSLDRQAYERDGYVVVRGCAPVDEATAQLDAAVAIARRHAAGVFDEGVFVTPEMNLAGREVEHGEQAASKVFRVHRHEPFRSFATAPDLTEAVAAILGVAEIDCFLSQFIFKNPGAWGQPCHQDSYYFPFTPARPVVGVWLAATDARLDNGCLHVVPASNREPVHEHVADRRPNANFGYMEIVDHDLSGAVPVEMDPGDLLLFDSHLMHFSTDNVSNRWRAAMVYHYAAAGTVDHTLEQKGYSVNDWMPALRK